MHILGQKRIAQIRSDAHQSRDRQSPGLLFLEPGSFEEANVKDHAASVAVKVSVLFYFIFIFQPQISRPARAC